MDALSSNIQGIKPYLPINTVKNAITVPFHIVATALSCVTLGKVTAINTLADREVAIEKDILRELFLDVAELKYGTKIDYPSCAHENDVGIFTEAFAKPITDYASRAARGDSFFKRHVVSRIAYGISALVGVVTRIVDLALGIIGALIFLAKKVDNTSAQFSGVLTHLSSNYIIRDLCLNLRMMVNPHQDGRNPTDNFGSYDDDDLVESSDDLPY
jgi:hypothetical protein